VLGRVRTTWIVAAFVVGAPIAACAIYDASLLLPANGNATSDAGEGGAPDAANADGGLFGCMGKHAPPKPTTEDGTADLDLVLAGHRLRFLPAGTATFDHPAAPTGLDLDSVCTCPGPESCMPLSNAMHCDGEGGTDDSVGDIFQTFALVAPDKFSDDAFNTDIAGGYGTIIFRVRSYNGGKNDKQVTLIVYASNGLDGIQDGGKPPYVPKADGTDVWTLDPSSLLGGTSVDGGTTCEGNDNICVPFYADTEAYVSDGVLVAHLDFPISVGSSDSILVVKLSDTIVTATLLEDAGTFHIDEGQVAGRWNTVAFLSAISTLKDPFNKNQDLCGDSGTYANIKDRACKGSDLMSDPAADNTGQPCDALSIAVSFSAMPAHLGPIFDSPSKPSTCGPGWKDDCSSVK
jgi:hypothetical protein